MLVALSTGVSYMGPPWRLGEGDLAIFSVEVLGVALVPEMGRGRLRT